MADLVVSARSRAITTTTTRTPAGRFKTMAGNTTGPIIIRIQVHIDTLCPWCYFQKKSLDRAIASFQSVQPEVIFEVVWKPFYLYPLLQPGIDKKSFINWAFGSSLAPLFSSDAREMPLQALSPAGTTGPSRPSHILLALALRILGPHAQAVLLEHIFLGHFTSDADISSHDWLVQLGGEIGLPEDVVRRELESRRAGKAVDDEVVRARDVIEVEAVPCLIVQEKYRVGGYQEDDVIERVLERVCAECEANVQR